MSNNSGWLGQSRRGFIRSFKIPNSNLQPVVRVHPLLVSLASYTSRWTVDLLVRRSTRLPELPEDECSTTRSLLPF